MKKNIISSLLSAFILFSCNSSNEDRATDNNSEITNTPFTEGSIEMGIYSNNIDLGKLVGKIDFSRADIKEQYEQLTANDPEVKPIFDLISNMGNQNPLVSWAVTLNIAECTYNIKENEVLGKVRGFGWTMDNYYNKSQDQASIYLETLTQTEMINEQDKRIYSAYKPSENGGSATMNELDLSLFNRETQNAKQTVSGYECDIVVYTPKTMDENTPIQLQKLVVYKSPLINDVINFAHPFYVEEKQGILRIDVYYLNTETPTLVMKPKQIKETKPTTNDLTPRTTTPVYTQDDINWGFKALGIMMSGWGMLEKN
ncbi:hypothetical protein H4K35_00675 [Myroides sp. NP-2]|uniref:hypothetical protein n=1 Tax=Myroides sp. NP-2 TaxID=2759945 RepID=UPI0015FBFCB5|nr:hypothetical protein [Myroides sp. NP-2]MBB1148659.1 hypothetical protein [Myroides sp. NP-2]